MLGGRESREGGCEKGLHPGGSKRNDQERRGGGGDDAAKAGWNKVCWEEVQGKGVGGT